jgi:uncharacterized membrane protein HdeD (DUF308 family)
MFHRLLRTPGAVAARGAAALAFGLLVLTWPTMTVATFVRLFAALAVVDGVAAAAAALRFRRRGRDPHAVRDPLFVAGAAGAALGLTVALWPDVTMQALLAHVALWAAVTGAGHLYLASRGRPSMLAWWLLGGAGAAGVALAATVVLALLAGDVRVGWPVGVYGLSTGALLLACAWRLFVSRAREPRRRATDDAADEAATLGAVPSAAVEARP